MDVFPPNLADLRPFQPISVRSDRSPPVPPDLRPFRPSSVRSDRSPPVPTNLRPFRPSSVRSAQSVTIGDGPHPEIGRRSQMLQFTIDPPRLLCWRRGYVLGWAGLWSRVSLSLTLAECVCRSRVRVCFVRRCSESRTGRAGGAWKPSQRPEPDGSGGSEGRVSTSAGAIPTLGTLRSTIGLSGAPQAYGVTPTTYQAHPRPVGARSTCQRHHRPVKASPTYEGTTNQLGTAPIFQGHHKPILVTSHRPIRGTADLSGHHQPTRNTADISGTAVSTGQSGAPPAPASGGE